VRGISANDTIFDRFDNLHSKAACDKFLYRIIGRQTPYRWEIENMNTTKYILLIAFLLFSMNAFAEFYKYVDENGDTRFTDDINEVPEAQRSKINSYVESQSKEVPEQQEAVENQAEPEETVPDEQQANFPDDSEDEAESLSDTKQRLDQMREELEEEFEALTTAKEKLAKEKDKAITREQIIEYNKKIDALNARVKAYDEKGKAYEAVVDAYNQRILKKNAEKKKQTQ
jgi:hypothetical protein